MLRKLAELHTRDWSLNLEDPYYAEHPDELLEEAVQAVLQTEKGIYVNIVTPDTYGDPNEQLIPKLTDRLSELGECVKQMAYIDQCGCGGYVTRVYK